MLAIIVGAIMTLGAVAKLGFIPGLISKPTMIGYMNSNKRRSTARSMAADREDTPSFWYDRRWVSPCCVKCRGCPQR
jgi:hypothetical protein